MNKKDKAMIYRLMQLFEAIPAGSTGGTRSASINGIIRAHNDFVEARTALRVFAQVLVDPDGEYDPNQVLDVFEQWVNLRRADGWGETARDFFWMYCESKHRNTRGG